MAPLLFIIYCVFFCWLISRLQFFKNSGLSVRILITLFMFRVLILIISVYVNKYYFPVSDVIAFHKMGLEEYHLLFTNPHEYFTNIYSGYHAEQYSRLLEDSKSFWNDLRSNLIAKMLSLFDILSLKDLLINHLFFNFLVFFGNVALYRVLKNIFPFLYLPLIVCCFLLPSSLFFSSMIHRDGLILLALSMFIYHIYFFDHGKQKPIRKVLLLLMFLTMIFLLRNFVLITMIPAIIAWYISIKNKKPLLTFFITYLICGAFFFLSGFISSKTDLPYYVSLKQQSFFKIAPFGFSTLETKVLHPNFKSFVQNAPEAFDHALLRPHINEAPKLDYLPFAIEILIMEVFFLVFLFYRNKKIAVHPLLFFGLFFSLSMIMVIGYTVPILGAIVRYRSIYLTFIMMFLLCYTDWGRVKNTYYK